MANEYENQAREFLEVTNTALSVEFLYTGPCFDGEKDKRDVYQFTLTNKRGAYSARFGDSIRNMERREYAKKHGSFHDPMNSPDARRLGFKTRADIAAAIKHKPSAYDILACLDVFQGSFSDFCADFGYDEDSRKAERVYFEVQKQSDGLRRIFSSEELESLQEIN